jgi:hypothetical protein
MKRGLCCMAVVLVILLAAPFMVFAAAPQRSATGTASPPLPLPLNGSTVLWDQSNTAANGVASQDFEAATESMSTFGADDFTNAQPWHIETIHVLGTVVTRTSLANASALHWEIYQNNGGVPAGFPGGGSAPLWSITLPPTDAQVTLTDSETDVTLALTSPIDLPPGVYWLVFYPSMDFTSFGQWFWSTATTANLQVAQMINPGGGFGQGIDWTNMQIFTGNVTEHDLAFRLDGQIAAGVPTLGQWGMIFFVLLLAAASFMVIRRRVMVRQSDCHR